MRQENVVFKYGNTNVTFRTDGASLKINATEMAKPFGKKPIDWLRLPSTIGFLKDLSEVRESHFGVIETVRGGDTGGGVTWMNRDVAIEFSRWLSNKFGIWCNDKILELLDKGTVSLNEQEKMLFGKKIKELENKVEELAPDAEFGKSVRHNADSIPVTMFSDFLVSNGCDIGRNQLYEFLRKNGYVYKKGDVDRNFPTRRSTKMRILETRYPSSTTEFGPTVYVTPKGIKYFLRRKEQIEAFKERQKAKVTKKINGYKWR